jgi:SAM-dependent methyltransferase
MYDAYAPIYDAIGQGQLSARMARWTLGWMSERGERPARVLDLACGTGEAALIFAAGGCVVAGVDRSAAMLEIARGKARDAGYGIEFVQGDICELEPRNKNQEPPILAVGSRLSVLGSQFDLVSCYYDSLNYLLGDRDLDRVFAGVARVLRPGGYLVFDLNTTAEYATWDERDSVAYDGNDCLVYNQLSYEPAKHMAEGRIVWFVRELDRWWRGEETHVERAWDNAEVQSALAEAGLELIGRYDTTGGAAAEDATRVVYVAQKSSREQR